MRQYLNRRGILFEQRNARKDTKKSLEKSWTVRAMFWNAVEMR